MPKSPTWQITTQPQSDSTISRDLIKAMAMEIGKAAVAHVEVMYPEAIRAASSTFKLSLRNHIHNDIVAIAELHDEAAIRAYLAKNETFRKEWVGMYRKMRRAKPQKREKPTRPMERLNSPKF